MPQGPLDKLQEIGPDIAAGFRQLRQGVIDSGPLAHEVVEFVVVGALVARRQHSALRVHLRRLLAMDVDVARLRQAVVAPLGAAATLSETVEALDILEELVDGGNR